MMLGHYCHDCPLVAGDPAFRHARAFFGTHSYIMHRRGLHKIFAYPHLMPIEKQIDAGACCAGVGWGGIWSTGLLVSLQPVGCCRGGDGGVSWPPPVCLTRSARPSCLPCLSRLQCWATCASRGC